MRPIFVKRLLVSLAIFALFLLYTMWTAVRMKVSTPLGHDYSYYRMDHTYEVIITCAPEDLSRVERFAKHPGAFNVGPSVDGYRVYDRVIVGHVSSPKRTDSYGDPIRLPSVISPTGYFVIDVRTDRIHDGLSKKRWIEVLKRFGIAREPELYKPSIYDKILGRNRPGKD